MGISLLALGRDGLGNLSSITLVKLLTQVLVSLSHKWGYDCLPRELS